MPQTEAQRKAQAKYVQQFQRQFMLKVNRRTEPEIVAWLEEKDSIQTYLKELIRKDMEASTKSST